MNRINLYKSLFLKQYCTAELLPSTMPSMTHDKQIILVNKTKRFPNDTEILDANGSPQVRSGSSI